MHRRTFLKAAAALPAASLLAGTAAGSVPPLPFASCTHALAQGDIRYLQCGDGPAALFIHGWPLNGTHWQPVMTRLGAARRCIAPDLMGLGHTRVGPRQELSPAAQATMLLDLMDALDLGQFDVVANDSGTCIAQLLAVKAPMRVRSLLLTNGDVDTNSPPPALAPALQAAREGHLDQLLQRHLDDPQFARSPQGLGGLCYTDPAHLTAEAAARYFGPLLATPLRRHQFQQYGVAFEPNPLVPVRTALAALRVPARLVWGTGDIHFPLATAYWLSRTLPLSRGVREVPGAKLFFTEEFPDLIAGEALRLWRA
jgi:pimeloyl-ACP methyl ester carboxylesterase